MHELAVCQRHWVIFFDLCRVSMLPPPSPSTWKSLILWEFGVFSHPSGVKGRKYLLVCKWTVAQHSKKNVFTNLANGEQLVEKIQSIAFLFSKFRPFLLPIMPCSFGEQFQPWMGWEEGQDYREWQALAGCATYVCLGNRLVHVCMIFMAFHDIRQLIECETMPAEGRSPWFSS